MKKLSLFYYFIVTILIPFSGIGLALVVEDKTAFLKETCTRYCHNHGCKHSPVLPEILTSDQHLYGDTIRFLYSFGEKLGQYIPISRAEGYGLANLLIFCLLIPVLHFGFFFLTMRRLNRSK